MIRILKGVKPGEVVMTAPPVKEEKEEEGAGEKGKTEKGKEKGDGGRGGRT